MKLLHTLLLAAVLSFSSSAFAEKININNASAEQIATTMTWNRREQGKSYCRIP